MADQPAPAPTRSRTASAVGTRSRTTAQTSVLETEDGGVGLFEGVPTGHPLGVESCFGGPDPVSGGLSQGRDSGGEGWLADEQGDAVGVAEEPIELLQTSGRGLRGGDAVSGAEQAALDGVEAIEDVGGG